MFNTELVSNEARLPQCALQEAACEPLWEEAVSKVTVVEPSETAMVSVEPMGSPPDLVLAVWDALKLKIRQRMQFTNGRFLGHAVYIPLRKKTA